MDLDSVQTNIVVFQLPTTVPLDALTLVSQAREQGVLLNAFAARTVRAVTHLDVNAGQCERAAAVLTKLLGPAA